MKLIPRLYPDSRPVDNHRPGKTRRASALGKVSGAGTEGGEPLEEVVFAAKQSGWGSPGTGGTPECSQRFPVAEGPEPLSPRDSYQHGSHRPLTSTQPLTDLLGTGSRAPDVASAQPGTGGPPWWAEAHLRRCTGHSPAVLASSESFQADGRGARQNHILLDSLHAALDEVRALAAF